MFSNKFLYDYNPYSICKNGYKDWSNKKILDEYTEFYSNREGGGFLQGNKITEGRLRGGRKKVLEFMKSTNYWSDEVFRDDKFYVMKPQKISLYLIS